jgi:hypothetical protein
VRPAERDRLARDQACDVDDAKIAEEQIDDVLACRRARRPAPST